MFALKQIIFKVPPNAFLTHQAVKKVIIMLTHDVMVGLFKVARPSIL